MTPKRDLPSFRFEHEIKINDEGRAFSVVTVQTADVEWEWQQQAIQYVEAHASSVLCKHSTWDKTARECVSTAIEDAMVYCIKMESLRKKDPLLMRLRFQVVRDQGL